MRKTDPNICEKNLPQGVTDEWGMGMNGDKFSPIHPRTDEWG